MFSTLLALLFYAAATVLAAPTTNAETANSGMEPAALSSDGTVPEFYYGKLDSSGNKVGKLYGTNLFVESSPWIHQKHDGISSCGPNWVPVGNFTNNGRSYIGFNTSRDIFCHEVSFQNPPLIVGPRSYAGFTVKNASDGHAVGLDHGKSPVAPDTVISPGHIEFEIHNKQGSGDHTPKFEDCVGFLTQLSMRVPKSKCYGQNNDDTKGGTFQLCDGGADISYHAIPNAN
ncbi:hypothetical protein HD806DRAFT_549089 [Xylariaceae sp. AK1471]|nr:hypothetical protein HD806DRAFT_549089 [Xylariaceae sp. AK1471]